MAPPLIVRAVLDASAYLKASNAVVTSNTVMGDSALVMGTDFTKSAQAQVAAGVKVIQSQRIQVAEYGRLAAAAVAGSDAAIVAAVNRDRANAALNRSLGVTAVATRGVAGGAKEAERDLGKLSRGALAGSGLFAKLGRSLAFASSGFIAVAAGSTLLAESIRSALDLAATQRQVETQLKVTGKTWEQYGDKINKADMALSHISGFDDSDLLQSFGYLVRASGNVSQALRLNAVAADVARGRHISLSSAALALGKALGGSDTALRRLGIIIPKNLSTMQALAYVQKTFAGQALAGATAADRFHAALVNTGEIIGTALLPTFDRLVTRLGNWFAKANETGRIQRDANEAIKIAGDVFHTLGGVIQTVDKITGSFGKTLLLVGEIWAGIKIMGWIKSLELLAVKWGIVEAAAVKAGVAEGAAAGGAGVLGARGAAVGVLAGGVGGRAARVSNLNFAMKAGELTAVSRTMASRFPVAIGAVRAAGVALEGFAPLAAVLISLQIIQSNTYKQIQSAIRRQGDKGGSFLGGIVHALTANIKEVLVEAKDDTVNFFTITKGYINQTLGRIKEAQAKIFPFTNSTLFPTPPPKPGPGTPPLRPGLSPIPTIKHFKLTMGEQLSEAQAALTQSTADDAASARRIIARITRLIDRGRLKGDQLIAALQAEASALSTLWAAEDAAAQKRAEAAQAAKERASTYNVPGYLQLAQAKAEAYGKSETAILKKIIAAAQHAINAGGKNWEGLVAAYGVITAARQQLEQDAQAAIIPLKLQLQLAKAQATGADQTSILRKMKAALERALKAARGNIQRQIDIWNQIASINEQLGANISNAYGDYKKASLRWQTEGLGLTPEQRRALEARLSQIGPGGTRPMSGTGAAGFIIDPETGRPIHRGQRRQGSQYGGGRGGDATVVNANIDLNVYIDGKQVEATVTNRQQRNHRRRPTQRRGPNAGTR